jgi:kynurenine 3-monooxygenase
MATVNSNKLVIIIGAGLAGTLLACYLGKLGYRVNVYERRGDPRRAGYSGGRSINLALSARGLWALEGVGLKDEILKHALPMRGRMMHRADESAELAFQPYSKNPADAINSISRGGLNIALLDAAEKYDTVELFFNQRCLDIDPDNCTATFQYDRDGGSGGDAGAPVGTVQADLILGADGAFSAVRTRLQKTDRFEYEQTFLSHGYKELHIPALPDGQGRFGGYALDPTALHIWPRGTAMMIALPNPDKTFTCTLFWPWEGEHSFANLKTPEQVAAFFRKNYPDTSRLMPTLVEDFLKNPTSALVTVRCWPWCHFASSDRATAILGDAAHAIVPFYGQGMNAAFEDVRTLAELLAAHPDNHHRALRDFQDLRKPNADAIARMALENFVEMRDKVGSRWFLWRKHLEHFLHDLMPNTLVPRYNLVSFSTVPYTQALAAGERFDRVIRGLIIIPLILLCFLLGYLSVPIWVLLIVALVTSWWLWERERARALRAEKGSGADARHDSGFADGGWSK